MFYFFSVGVFLRCCLSVLNQLDIALPSQLPYKLVTSRLSLNLQRDNSSSECIIIEFNLELICT